MSEKNTIETLRECLFATLKDLRDPQGTLTLERAKAINETAQTIINSAKAEIAFMELTGETATGFIPAPEKGPGEPQRQRLPGPRRWP